MRTSIDIIPNPHLKGLDCKFPQLPGLQSGTIVRLAQNNNSIFVLYQVSGENATSSMNKAQIPSKLCQLNNIVQGSMQMQPIANLQQCRKLTVYVNKLDYEIINNKVQGLQEQFMNQVTLVWPNAKIPLYYDKSNFVSFRVQCDSPAKLVQNSELEVLLQRDGNQTKAQAKAQQYICRSIKILPISMQNTGNINKIYINRAHQILKLNLNSSFSEQSPSKKNGISSISEQTMPSSIKNSEKVVKKQRINEKAQLLKHRQAYEFRLKYKSKDDSIINKFPCDTNKLSIKQQISMIKRRQQNVKKSKKVQKLLVQLQLIEEKHEDENIKTYINLKQQNKQQMKEQEQNVIYINECIINNWNINLEEGLVLECIPKVNDISVCKKLQYLLNQKDLNIHIYVSQKNQRLLQDVDTQFIETFLSSLIDDKQENKEMKIYGKIPYMIRQSQRSNRLSYINIKRGEEIIGDPLTITYNLKAEKVEKSKQQKQKQNQVQKIKQKLLKAVKITNYFYQDQNLPQITLKTNILNQLSYLTNKKSINNPENMMVNSANNGIEQKNEQSFIQLYKICYQQQINKLLQCMADHQSGIYPEDRYILITSFSNNGKTIMDKIIRQRGYNTLYIDISQMDDVSLNLSDLSEYLQLVFQLYDGAFIFMDNLDSVCYKIDQGDQHRRQERIASKLLVRKIMKFSKQYKKTCIMTAKNEGNLDEQFHHYQLIKLKNPTRELREHILQQYYRKMKQNIPSQIRQNESRLIQQIVVNSQSMSFGQFSKYVISGYRQSTNFGDNKGVANFSKLAGIKQAKSSIRTVIQRPNKYGFVYRKLPIKLSRGILLYGGSGTGKSAIGEALAGQFKMKFFTVKGSDILSKYIGGSEAAVRDVFEKAMSVSPSIVFFDQFQSIVPRRNSSNTGVTDRVVNQFLCYLDGVASVQGVYIVASSSRPELIDPALLRPGRIDTHIFLDYPSKQERQQLLTLYSNSIQFETEQSDLLKMTEGYSYSDLIGLIKELRIKQSAKILKSNTNLNDVKIDQKQFKYIDDKFLRETMLSYQTSTPKEEKDRERKKYLAFKRGDAPDMTKQKTILQ